MRVRCCGIVVTAIVLMTVPGAVAAEPPKLEPLVRVLQSVDDAATQRDVLVGIHAALRDRQTIAMPAGWDAVYQKLSRSTDAQVREEVTLLSLLFGDEHAR